MARLRYNGLSTTLGVPGLTSSATAVTFGAALTHSGGTNVPTITGTDYVPLSILDAAGKVSEIVYLTAYTSGATTGTITRGQEGTTGVSHASGDKVIHGPTATDVSFRYASLRCNTGTITVNTSSLAVVSNASGAGAIQVTIPSAAGDILEVGLNAQASDNSATTVIDLNVATFVAGAETNRVGGAGTTGSIPSWSVRNVPFWPVNGTVYYTVQSADLNADGTVNLRLLGLIPGGGSRGLFSTSTAPLDFVVRNLGQPK